MTVIRRTAARIKQQAKSNPVVASVLPEKPKPNNRAESAIAERQSQMERSGHSAIRAKGKTAIRSARAELKRYGVTPGPSLRLPTPKRKPRI